MLEPLCPPACLCVREGGFGGGRSSTTDIKGGASPFELGRNGHLGNNGWRSCGTAQCEYIEPGATGAALLYPGGCCIGVAFSNQNWNTRSGTFSQVPRLKVTHFKMRHLKPHHLKLQHLKMQHL